MPRLTKLAKKVIFIAQDEIADLLKDNEYGVEVIAKSELNLDKLQYDYFCTCMSIPHALKLTRENISVGEGFIKAPVKFVEDYKEKYFNTKKLKVGFAFLGLVNQTRNIPFETLLKLDKLKNAHFYCLSQGVSDKQLKKFKRNKVTNIVADFNTFAQTAAAIENLDIVVSSDNCILNLAGALGKKTMGLFAYNYEFRWYDLSGENSGWFTSVKPIVNNKENDWNLSMDKAIEEVKKFQKSIGK